jgi:hypothetical protein
MSRETVTILISWAILAASIPLCMAGEKNDQQYTVVITDGIPVPVCVDGQTYTTYLTGTVGVHAEYVKGTGVVVSGEVDLHGTPVALANGGSLEEIGVQASYSTVLGDWDSGYFTVEAEGTFTARYVSPGGASQGVSAAVGLTLMIPTDPDGQVQIELDSVDIDLAPTGAGVVDILSAWRSGGSSVQCAYYVSPPPGGARVDVYLAVATQSGSFLFVNAALKTTGDVVPVLASALFGVQSGSLGIELGGAAEGSCTWYSVFARPGSNPYDSANWLSNLETQPSAL